jgi:hypothetical protein
MQLADRDRRHMCTMCHIGPSVKPGGSTDADNTPRRGSAPVVAVA